MIDARDERVPNENIVPGSISLPYVHEDDGLSFRAAFQAHPFIVYSNQGQRARGAEAVLKRMGFSNTINACDGARIRHAMAEGPTPEELADLESAEQDLVAARDAYERAARIAAKAATVQIEAKSRARAVGQEAASAAETIIAAKLDYERVGKLAAAAAHTVAVAKQHAREAGQAAAAAAATIITAKEGHDRAARIAAKAAATQMQAKESAHKVGVEAAAAAVIQGRVAVEDVTVEE